MRARVRVAFVAWVILLLIIGGYGLLPAVVESTDLRKVEAAQGKVYDPVARLTTALQQERNLSVQLIGRDNANNVPLLSQRRKFDQDLWSQRRTTDQAITAFRESTSRSLVRDNRELSRRSRTALSQLSNLAEIRAGVDNREPARRDVMTSYTGLIDTMIPLFQAMPENDDLVTTEYQLRLFTAQRLREATASEFALLSGAIAQGQLTASDRSDFGESVIIRRHLTDELQSELSGSQRREFDSLVKGAAFTKLRDLESQTSAADPNRRDPAVAENDWVAANTAVLSGLSGLESGIKDAVVKQSESAAWGILIKATLITAAVLIVGLVLMITWFRVAPRHVLRELSGLKETALDFAENRLPSVVAKLQHGEQVDVQREVPPLKAKRDEFGDVGRAFNLARQVAVQAAVDQAELRNGIKDVFVNLARRSQSLIHRQLSLLDKMERDATGPEELERLFAIDHLATRIRRHAEDLIILSGAAPGRQWRKPVPMINVIRSAIGEIESYNRVSVLKVDGAQLSGRVVADVIPLLSALLDNATSYSRPQTKVRVVGAAVPNGYVVEIEDSGLGMTEEELARFNLQLKKRPEFNPSETVQLGLFVVAHLAHRHDINVALHKSPYGGTTAIVLLPSSLLDSRTLPLDAATPAEENVDSLDLPRRPRDGRLDESSEFLAPDATPTDARLLAAGDADVSDDVGDEPEDNPAEPLGDPDELPRRERQANLAEELRTGFTDDLPNRKPDQRREPDGEENSERTPEQIQAMMTKFQRGSIQGKKAADALDLPPVDHSSDVPVH